MVTGTDSRGRELLVKGIHLQFLRDGGNEFVERLHVSGVACVLAVDAERRILLIEQHRAALGRTIIELPGGMAGDRQEESLAEAAARELREETGYAAGELRYLGEGPSSAGLTNETITFFLALGARKIGAQSVEDAEKAKVHLVPLLAARSWLSAKAGEGYAIDYRIYACLFLAEREIGSAADSADRAALAPA